MANVAREESMRCVTTYGSDVITHLMDSWLNFFLLSVLNFSKEQKLGKP